MAVVGNKSTYLQELVITTYLKTGAVYLGLVSDTATDEEMEAGTLTNEITGYTGNRKAITWGAIAEVLTKATVKNSALIEFLSMPAPAGREIKYVIVCDAATAGHILYWCPLSAAKVWNVGDPFTHPIDTLVVDEA